MFKIVFDLVKEKKKIELPFILKLKKKKTFFPVTGFKNAFFKVQSKFYEALRQVKTQH